MSVEILDEFIQAADACNPGDFITYHSDSNDPERYHPTPDIHQRTWQIYLETTRAVHGPEKIAEICERYGLDPDGMQRDCIPLSAQMVRTIEMGASIIKVDDIYRAFFGRTDVSNNPFATWTQKQINDLVMSCHPTGYLGQGIPNKIMSVPTSYKALLKHDQILMDKEILQLSEVLKGLQGEHAFEELFLKALIARELQQGMLIPYKAENGDLCYFEVYQTIVTGEGLVAYALKPLSTVGHPELQPFIFFRGTQLHPSALDGLSTLINDLEKNIGLSGYRSGKPAFDALLADPLFCKPYQQIKIGGFSLGGVHAQRFLNDYSNQVSEAVFFCDLGIEYGTAQAFADCMNNQPRRENPLKMTIYRTQGDIADYLGQAHLGWKVRHPDVQVELREVIPNKDLAIPSYGGYYHTYRFFDDPEPHYQIRVYRGDEADQQLENAKRGFWVKASEIARRVLGSYFLCHVIKAVRFVWRKCVGWRGQDRVLGLFNKALNYTRNISLPHSLNPRSSPSSAIVITHRAS